VGAFERAAAVKKSVNRAYEPLQVGGWILVVDGKYSALYTPAFSGKNEKG
jgi:hypothetical protein